jgi:hypothetical protein
MAQGARQRWFAQVLQAGIDEKILVPAQVLSHVTPEVLAHHLPPELMSKLLTSALGAGAMTPERVFDAVGPDILAEHIPLEVLWTCIAAAAETAGISGPDKSA